MSQTILVADDDADNRAIAAFVLEGAGYRVLQARDGLEAVETACREKPDLVILDLTMPRLDGWEAARRIKSARGMAATPIVAFTAHALDGAEARARAAGCDGYLAKPCMPRQVLEKVRENLP